MEFAIIVVVKDEPGVLSEISEAIAENEGNITFTQQFLTDGEIEHSKIYFEVSGVKKSRTKIIEDLKEMNHVLEVSETNSFSEVFGDRVIIIGGGAQVSEVAKGAISEADRHNIRGEKISVDTIPLVGEETLSEAVKAVEKLHRAKVLVLAGALLGGEIREAIREIEEIDIISLQNLGSVKDVADLVVSDPTLAGVLAVMSISKKGNFELDRVKGKKI